MNFENLVIGFAIGDAFGAGVEFQDRDWIRANVDFTKFINARHLIQVPKSEKQVFIENYKAWDYTDDTEMLIASIKALSSNQVFSEELLIQKISEEYQKGIKEKGFGRNGHGSLGWYFSGEKTIEEIRFFQKNRVNPGNAPLSRAIPLGFLSEEKINPFAKINANATHPHENAIFASQCIAWATEFLLVKNGNHKEIIDYCQEKVQLNAEFQTYFEAINQLGKYEDLSEQDFEILCGKQPIPEPYFLAGIKGLPSDAKYTAGAALYILKNSQDAFDALKKSIYLGGDVDSLASITVGILAAKFGLDPLPNFMIKNVEGIDYLRRIANMLQIN